MTTRQEKRKAETAVKKPEFVGWHSSDEEEIARRKWRGVTEVETFEALEQEHGPFGSFKVPSSGGGSYLVEIRSLTERENSCDCADFHVSGLGTCKHVEGVLHLLRKSRRRSPDRTESPRVEIYPSNGPGRELKIAVPARQLPDGFLETIKKRFDGLSKRCGQDDFDDLERIAAERPDILRISALCGPWRKRELVRLRRERKRAAFIENEKAGKQSVDVLELPLFPYQRAGVRHLALGERSLLADEMGLGKTMQAIGACKLLNELENVSRALVICPASLKTEWAEQIGMATDLSHEIVFGSRAKRLAAYKGRQFFTITNYEQVLFDLDQMQEFVKPDIIILDEAQRIKNWRTKTANAIKKLQSRFAFVLTGTPLENRIDELYSIMQFLDPEMLGPLFRFNREYYQLDDRGRAFGYKNLDKLREKTRQVMLRRRKADVEGDLPEKITKNHYLPMTEEQQVRYRDYERVVASILQRAKKRQLMPEEFQRLQVGLASMRMICDTPYILDQEVRDCPKLEELERVLEDMLEDDEGKIIIFSEWVRMLDLVRDRIEELGIGYAWHTGSVPQDRRRVEINRFKEDPACRIFLSSESGGVGLNLQAANNVINLDLPWNPAKLEQRIARAWRKHQKRAVTVVNLITSDSIEHRMVSLLKQKQAVADNVLDGKSGQTEMDLPSGRAAFIERLESVMGTAPPAEKPESSWKDDLVRRLNRAFGSSLLAAELRNPAAGKPVVLAVLDSKENAESPEFPAKPDEPRLEIIDRETYDAMLRLEAAGLLQFSPARRETLFSAGREENKHEQARRNRKIASGYLDQAERKKKMAELLSGGGFASEADAAAPSIADFALRALAAYAGHETDDAQWTDEHIWQVCDALRDEGLITQEQQFKVSWICQGEDGRAETDESDGKLPAAKSLLAHAEALLKMNPAPDPPLPRK